MAINILDLWDFGDLDLSERRFRDAQEWATPDEQLILQTQIARVYGIRSDFTKAQELLSEIATHLNSGSEELRVRFDLEFGRTLCSPVHPPESQTDEVRSEARLRYLAAAERAKLAGLDYLEIDALHMMAMVELEPEQQLEWDRKALEAMEDSPQPEAKKWEASLRNNLGYAYNLAGRYEESLEQFQLALALRERTGNHSSIKVARWMIGWTLRCMGRLEQALEIQKQLEADSPSIYVYQELKNIYHALNNPDLTAFYEAKGTELGKES